MVYSFNYLGNFKIDSHIATNRQYHVISSSSKILIIMVGFFYEELIFKWMYKKLLSK